MLIIDALSNLRWLNIRYYGPEIIDTTFLLDFPEMQGTLGQAICVGKFYLWPTQIKRLGYIKAIILKSLYKSPSIFYMKHCGVFFNPNLFTVPRKTHTIWRNEYSLYQTPQIPSGAHRRGLQSFHLICLLKCVSLTIEMRTGPILVQNSFKTVKKHPMASWPQFWIF